MKVRGILNLLTLVIILSSCSGDKAKGDTEKNSINKGSLSSGEAFFPYFERVPGLSTKKRYTFGYMDKKGKRVTENRFRDAHVFTNGLGCVSTHRDDQVWYGYINASGTFVIKPKYSRARPFQEQRAVVSPDFNSWLVIDMNGKELTEAKYSIISDYHNGVCYGYVFKKKVQKRVFLKRTKEKSVYDCYRIDKDGNERLIATETSNLDYQNSGTLANMDNLGMYWLNDANDDRIYGYKKLTLEEFNQSPWSSCGNYSDSGSDQINAQYIDAECFLGGFARVKLSSGKSAYIDTNGKMVCTFTDDR